MSLFDQDLVTKELFVRDAYVVEICAHNLIPWDSLESLLYKMLYKRTYEHTDIINGLVNVFNNLDLKEFNQLITGHKRVITKFLKPYVKREYLIHATRIISNPSIPQIFIPFDFQYLHKGISPEEGVSIRFIPR